MRGRAGIESQTKSTGTTLATAPDRTAHHTHSAGMSLEADDSDAGDRLRRRSVMIANHHDSQDPIKDFPAAAP